MHDHIGNSQLLGPRQLHHHPLDRLVAERSIGRRQVDQIRGVRDRMRDLQLRQRRAKLPRLLLRDRLGPPLRVVLREELHHIAPAPPRLLHRLVIPAGNRHVGAEREGL